MANRETKLQIVVDAVNNAGSTFASIGKNLDSVKQSTEELRSGMLALGAAGTVAFGGLAFLTKGIVEAGANFEQTKIAFETMLGSAETAQKTLADLSAFAARTPFELPQLEQASKQLLAYGTTAEDLIPTLTMLGDITAGVGMDKLPQLILAFGQVKAATKLTGMELRQFTEAGVPILDALVQHFNKTGGAAKSVGNAAGLTAKQIKKLEGTTTSANSKLHSLTITLEKQTNRLQTMANSGKLSSAAYKNLQIDIQETQRKIAEAQGTISKNTSTLDLASQSVTSFGEASKVTAAQVQQMVSDGTVSFADVQAALGSLTGEGGRFFNLMDKQSQSLGGLWSTLKDNITLTARAVGTELVPYLKPLVTQLIELTKSVGEFVKQHPQLSAFLLMFGLGLTAILAVMLPISLALPGLTMLFAGLGIVFGAVTAISAPLLLAIAGISTALILLAANGYFTKNAWQDVWLGIKVITAEAANAVIKTVESMINFIISGVNTAIAAINRVISLAQKVPGIGSKLSTLSTISSVQLQQFDTGTIAASDLAARSGASSGSGSTVQVSGNVLLSQDVAERIGDLIMGRLKLSNQV